jgi:septum formation protein
VTGPGAPTLVLASRSPQRRAILARLGVVFEVRAPGVDEAAEGDPARLVQENARRKAGAVAAGGEGRPVLGVDTLVALDGRPLGQPPDAAAARAMLRALAGREHQVHSGVCLRRGGRADEALATTRVRFRALGDAELDWYVAGGEWRGRAGGYAIQERGMALVERLEGDYTNVVGLPVPALLRLWPGLLTGG